MEYPYYVFILLYYPFISKTLNLYFTVITVLHIIFIIIYGYDCMIFNLKSRVFL